MVRVVARLHSLRWNGPCSSSSATLSGVRGAIPLRLTVVGTLLAAFFTLYIRLGYENRNLGLADPRMGKIEYEFG
jgi:hypothetical protein